MKPIFRAAAGLGVLVLAGALSAGCGNKKLNPIAPENMRPEVRITSAPIDTNAACTPNQPGKCYSLDLNWVGYDVDGRVDYFKYAVDPEPGDTNWVNTTDSEKRLVFQAPKPDPADSLGLLRGFHTFVIRAVDNKGAVGPRAERSFFSFTVAPTVGLSTPRAVEGSEPVLAPALRINWFGQDPDGLLHTKPVMYKWLLIDDNQYPGRIDSLNSEQRVGPLIRRYYAPRFDGWTTVCPIIGDAATTPACDTNFVRFSNLIPGSRYLFTIVAFDEAGAYSPNFSLNTNVLIFKVGYASSFGPKITMFNEFFFYQYTGGSYYPSPLTEVRIEVPANQKITFNWFADPPQGAEIKAYRWMLDGDVYDPHTRDDEEKDTYRWSTPSSLVTSATVGPFAGDDHYFYIEAEDNTGLKSLGTIHFNAVAPTFDRGLLVVKDWRFKPDEFLANGDVKLAGNWPTSAELDTFLFAQGGYPWKAYPPGTQSPPGVLKGYECDTMSTKTQIEDLHVSLGALGKYQRVLWIIDYDSAIFTKRGTDQISPMTALRYMATPGRLNTLAVYVRQGGEVWLCGGGAGYATNIPFNDNTNDISGASATRFSMNSIRRELVPGRFMYDIVRWRSEFLSSKSSIGKLNRYLGRFESNPGLYASLPSVMELRDPATDPIPPGRSATSFYASTFSVEFLNHEFNIVEEPVIGDPIDFQIDNFDGDAVGVHLRWPSSDSLNTVVGQSAVASAGSSGASKFAMRIHTAGGGGSTGDIVERDLGVDPPRDWSGLRQLKLAIKQDQPTSAVQWRVRIVDSRGASASALIPVSKTGEFVAVAIPGPSFVTDSPTQPSFVNVRKVQFELAQGSNPGNTEIDNLEVTTLPDGAVLDTLMVLRNSFTQPQNSNGTINEPPGNGTTMTYYHGHDTIRPFLFSGFAPWQFKRSQCEQLFDFVFQKLWGYQRIDKGGAHKPPQALRVASRLRQRGGSGPVGAVVAPPSPSGSAVGVRDGLARRAALRGAER